MSAVLLEAVLWKAPICFARRRYWLVAARARRAASLADPLDGGLLFLKNAYNESDESVCDRWAQDVHFPLFCGEEYFQARMLCDPTNLVRFRQTCEAGVDELPATTIAAAT